MTRMKLCNFQINIDSAQRLFYSNGVSPFQDPRAIQARLHALSDNDFVCYAFCNDELEIEVITAFERMGTRLWRCFMLGEGFLATKGVSHAMLFECLKMIVDHLERATLYFPYIDSRSPYFSFFSLLDKPLCLKRLPSPFIKWVEENDLFIEKIKKKSKRRAQRFWNKFERHLTIKALEGEDGISALDAIERSSWKYQARQSMHDRDKQFAFYSDWLRQKGLFMHVAVDSFKPVAYVLSSKVNNTVYTIKYSYDAEYKDFSPGYYLLTKGNYVFWEKHKIETIDLWGSPDTLKNSIKSGEYPRFDFVWPANESGHILLEERKHHDTKLLDALDQGQGLRKIFKQK